jgi:hypothetical protein
MINQSSLKGLKGLKGLKEKPAMTHVKPIAVFK